VDALYRDFGRRLRAARKKTGLTQEELGRRVDLGRTSITNIENGTQHIALHQLFDLARAVGLPADSLLPVPPFDGQRRLPAEASKMMRTLNEQEEAWVLRVVGSHQTEAETREES
jgi:transcriptional regulator with XRE-family HTH domain